MLRNLSEDELEAIGCFADELGFKSDIRVDGITITGEDPCGIVEIVYNINEKGGELTYGWEINRPQVDAGFLLDEEIARLSAAKHIIKEIQDMANIIEVDSNVYKTIMYSIGDEDQKQKIDKLTKDELIDFIVTALTVGCFDELTRRIEFFNDGIEYI
jgi:hypothetical protein